MAVFPFMIFGNICLLKTELIGEKPSEKVYVIADNHLVRE